jgi:DNA polymerase I-like protein with 3'-5' exonuclease and polymerase domains
MILLKIKIAKENSSNINKGKKELYRSKNNLKKPLRMLQIPFCQVLGSIKGKGLNWSVQLIPRKKSNSMNL